MKNKINKFLPLISILALCIVFTMIFFGFILLGKKLSSTFVLNASMSNQVKEKENSIKTKKLFLENSDYISKMNKHTILNEDQIPNFVEMLEMYAEKVNTSIEVSNISVGEQSIDIVGKPATEDDIQNSKNKAVSSGGDTSQGIIKSSSGNKSLSLDVKVNGNFNDLINFIKLLNNGDYITSINSYSLVLVEVSNTTDGQSIFKEVNSKNITNKLTWLLSLNLKVDTFIK